MLYMTIGMFLLLGMSVEAFVTARGTPRGVPFHALGSETDYSFTAAVAYQPDRHQSRTVPSLAEGSLALDRVRQGLSVLTFGVGVGVGVVVSSGLLLSSILTPPPVSVTEKKKKNRSVVKGGSRTAILALLGRSQAYLQNSGGPDHVASQWLDCLLPWPVRLCASLSRFNFWLTHRIFEDQVGRVATLGHTGLVSTMQVRTCWLDDCVEAFVQQHAAATTTQQEQPLAKTTTTTANLVILGAGFDSRYHRLVQKVPGVFTYEVDAPGTQAEKKRVLQTTGMLLDDSTTSLVLVPCDFETQDCFECLMAVGGSSSFDASLPTLILWEGVTMYLPETVVVDTLKRVASLSSGTAPWYIAFDYISSTWATSAIWRRAMQWAGEPFQFAMSGRRAEAEELVQSCGLQLLEHLNDSEELARRYLPTHPSGKPVGFLGDYGGFVVAATKSLSD